MGPRYLYGRYRMEGPAKLRPNPTGRREYNKSGITDGIWYRPIALNGAKSAADNGASYSISRAPRCSIRVWGTRSLAFAILLGSGGAGAFGVW